MTLRYDDVTEWRLRIGKTDIAEIIKAAQTDPGYVLRMRAHDGARHLLEFLHSHSRVMIITARGAECLQATRQWLHDNHLEHDGVETSAEAKKSVHGTNLLVDDYIGNLIEFLTNTRGVAVLVDQPWNRERSGLEPFIRDGRAFVVETLIEIKERWSEIVAAVQSQRRVQPTAAVMGEHMVGSA